MNPPIDLVTGGTGLVGSNLVRQLIRRHRKVRILVRNSSKISQFDGLDGLEFAAGDVTDLPSLLAATEGVDMVYHLAANVSITRRMSAAMWQVNVTGTENILKAVQERGVRRLVHCSSEDALGLPEGPEASTETTPWNWDRLGVENGYARSKYEAHQRVLAAAQRGCDAVLVCPGFMFGAYDARPSSGQMILAISQHRLPGYPGGGNNFVDVLDVTSAMLSAAEAGKAGEVYILGGANQTYREIFAIIADIVHAPRPRYPIPYPLAWIGGQAGGLYEWISGRDLGLNPVTVKISYLNHYFNPAKAVRELGMPQTPIENAIERAAAWMKTMNMLDR